MTSDLNARIEGRVWTWRDPGPLAQFRDSQYSISGVQCLTDYPGRRPLSAGITDSKTRHELPDPTELVEGEFAKSKTTRTRILEAAIGCLAETGYSATSTNSVATAAGITRAALLYHFPSRGALIEAVIQYVTRRRVEMQEEYARELPRDEQYPVRAIDRLWEQVNSREFWAFTELSVAARTSKNLARMFKPAMEAFDRSRREMALKLAQPHIINEPGFDLRWDISRFLMEGLAQQDGITFNREQRVRELFGFLKLLYTDKRLDAVFAHVVQGGQKDA